jgi:DME family drug/metabolite transporter
MDEQHRLLPRLEVLAAAVLFSTGGAAVKLTHFTSWQVAGFRSGIAAAVLLLLLPETRRGWNVWTFIAGLAYAATLILFVTATKLTTAANAIFLQSAAPLYVMLLGPLLLKENARRSDLPFMAVIGIGLSLFFAGDTASTASAPNPALGNLFGLVSGLTWALVLIALRWMARGGSSTAGITTAAAGNLIAFAVCLPLALPVQHTTNADVGAVAYLGIFQVALAYYFLNRGLRHVPVLESSALLLAEPALNPVWAWLLLGERQPLLSVTGGALILGASTANLWWRTRGQRK